MIDTPTGQVAEAAPWHISYRTRADRGGPR